jgi:RNA polymerase sigma-70 factor, ECF subfamily
MNSPNPHSNQIDLNTGFLRLWTQHEQALRALIRSCVPRTSEVDEVMQSDSIVAWQKFSTLNEPAKFGAWVAMIARYEVLLARRRVARERLVLDEDIIAKLAEEGAQEMPLRHRQLNALDGCVAKLPEERRKLALAAYGLGVSMKDLAAQLGRTEGSLYQLIARIRQELSVCVEKALREELPV